MPHEFSASAFIERNKNNTRPLFRWTVGPSPFGNKILFESCRTFSILYGDLADGVAVFNSCFDHKTLEKFQKELCKYNVDCIKADIGSLPLQPKHTGWKFYPPRLRMQSHEIFIDSDLVMLARGWHINNFLSSNKSFANKGVIADFGSHTKDIRDENIDFPPINAGIFGFPPKYDINEALIEHIGWEDWFDEQGLTTRLVVMTEYQIIPDPVIYNYHNCDCGMVTTYFSKYPTEIYRIKERTDEMEGFHFITGNQITENPAWIYYEKKPFGFVNKLHPPKEFKSFYWSTGITANSIKLT